MKHFAQLLNQLYYTYSHLAKEKLLHQYFANTPDPERGYAVAIMADTLEFPTFKRSLMRELIQEQVDEVLLELSYDYVGDLSETIALLWNTSENFEALPALSTIIFQCQELKSHELTAYLKQLLNQSNANERWALLKLGTGSLRIGVSARFIKKVLASYGGKSVDEIEHLWHGLKPPYESLFAWLEHKAPMPDIQSAIFFHPLMLSHPLEEKELPNLMLNDFLIERKYDGIRVQLVSNNNEKILYSRSGDDISNSFPDALAAIQTPVILDGELVIYKAGEISNFNTLQQRLNRKVASKQMLEDSPAGIILYDILSIDYKDLRPLPMIERRALLERWYQEHQPYNMLLSDLLETQNVAQLRQQVLAEKHQAVEGLMLKRKDSAYIAGRPRNHWYKWKRDPLLVDAVLMYAQRGHGKRSSFYSDYTFGLWQEGILLPVGKAYSGFTDEELIKIDRWVRRHTIHRFGPVREVEKVLVMELAFDAVNVSKRHKSGVGLRFPRVHRIRWDKPASEADLLDYLKKFITN